MKLIKVQQDERIYEFTKPMAIERVYRHDNYIGVEFAERAHYTRDSIACSTRWILYEGAKIHFEDGTIVSRGHSTLDELYELITELVYRSNEEPPEVTDIMDIIF